MQQSQLSQDEDYNPKPKRARQTRRKPARSDSMSEDEIDMERRQMHNTMERKRRVGLRHCFTDLKNLVPSLEKQKKAAKVTILTMAAKLVYQLMDEENNLSLEKDYLMKKREMLIGRLNRLKIQRGISQQQSSKIIRYK